MWDVAAELDDGVGTSVQGDTTWRVAQIRLEFGPAPTVGALLASLGEILTFSRILPYDLEFFETPEGRFMYTHCELLLHHGEFADALAPLLRSAVIL